MQSTTLSSSTPHVTQTFFNLKQPLHNFIRRTQSRVQFPLESQLRLKNQIPIFSNLNPLTPCSSTSPKRSFPLHCGISSNTFDADSNKSLKDWIEVASEAVSTAFPIWVALGCLLGLVKPSSFSWVTPKLTVFGISLTMLGMGITLTLDDLRGAFAMPKEIFSGFCLQYSVMPLSGFFVSKLLNLPSYYAAGLILVACCPGGTASNIVTYIARGNVALSVLMIAASTLSAVIMTPFLTAKLAGQYVAVDAAGLLTSTLQVVLLPVLAGAFFNQYFQGLVKLVSLLMPPIAVGTVAVLCGHAIAQSSSAILMSGRQVLLAASLLHASGFLFGYVLARMLGIDVSSSRTISIEVGMQNSVLGVVLATAFRKSANSRAVCCFQCLPFYIWQYPGWNLETFAASRKEGVSAVSELHLCLIWYLY